MYAEKAAAMWDFMSNAFDPSSGMFTDVANEVVYVLIHTTL
jgi:hypothetical protein